MCWSRISVSTLFTGFLLFGLGALKLGQWLRFIPYPVIAGFLAASGWLLITGGVEVVTQSNLTLAPASWAMLYSSVYGPQILVGLALRRRDRLLCGDWCPPILRCRSPSSASSWS